MPTRLSIALAAAVMATLAPLSANAQDVGEKPVEPPKKTLRVLLVTSGPQREYSFLRTLLFRATMDKRLELCIHNQSGEEEVNDAEQLQRQLADLPDNLGPSDRKRRFMSLMEHDVIVAFDPDWSKFKPAQLELLREWVDRHAGGFIFVAGPVHTFQLSRPLKELQPVKAILPVLLKDIRLVGVARHDPPQPSPLNFTPEGMKSLFLKLADDDAMPAAGWNGFFWGDKDFKPNPAKPVEPKRGFYNYYPVEKLQAAATVLATFAGPKGARINDGADEQPFLVSMRFGAGKTLYISSGELWRLREFRDRCHERLWLNMIAAFCDR